jgi:hypothetical protein
LFDSGDDSDYIRRDGVKNDLLESQKKQYSQNIKQSTSIMYF